ncbi:MAG: GLPGLI family protein [Muribaculaceae bacterium]|nr:GLPGLI family protein [Muribaculaceae bacterium]
MKRIILYFILGLSLPLIAEDKPLATLKAEYKAISHELNNEGDTLQNINKFILQIAPEKSYFYNTQTYYVDSMENDPQGRILYEEALKASISKGKEMFKFLSQQGFMPESRYRCLKDFNNNNMRIWDSNMGSKYRYDIDMADLIWELGDSIKTVVGYECQNAYADYHGRKWEVWFAPDIPIKDGPWQLFGLPGLIMEATTDDGLYSFEIIGIQECNEPFKPTFEDERYFITKRKSFLKQKDYSIKNRAAMVNAMTNGKVNLSNSINSSENNIDFIETDYKE